ncbi:MAG TPA: HEPN domain-containing protein [Candidatus Tectomicrobia bacterium]
MTEEQKRGEVVRYRWERAHTSLKAAGREAAAGDYPLAINRAYYALFYAVSALLLEEGRRFGKHTSVRAAFNRDIIRAGRLSETDGDIYNQLFRDRHEGDYVEFTKFDAQYVQVNIEACEEFLAHLRPLLNSLPADAGEM